MAERSIEHASFTIERRYEASPAKVFAAWADPAAKVRWFKGPDEWEAATHELDFRAGGVETNVGGPPGGPVITYRAIYWDIVANERIVYTYEMLSDERRMSVSLATVELRPDGEGTRLTVTEHGAFFDGVDDPTLREQGTGSLLDALALALAGRDT
ncbi:MAG: hypothetical protein QOI10_2821 [Solirubrobacterales bacterium]|jgi:uncharacterized protein YndB with AHSA1/START domain|nr:hypothetical protein [Solirubrobacterales bacterium]